MGSDSLAFLFFIERSIAMSPIEFPIDAFGSFWELLCCGVTVLVAAFTFVLMPR